MKSQATMICCYVFFLATECSHYRPMIHIQDGDKPHSAAGKLKTGHTEDAVSLNICKDTVTSFLIKSMKKCHQKMWQKSTETCTSLSVETLFKDSNAALHLSLASASIPLNVLDLRAPEPVESITQGILKNCPFDFACIINPVKSSEATSGNIAFIVELLRNISIHLSDKVTREKMKSYSKVANHILSPAALANWTFVPDKRASSDLLHSVNSFASHFHVNNESEDIVDELFIQTKGFPIDHSAPGKGLNFSLNVNNSTEGISGMVEIPWQELQKLPSTSQAIGIAFPTLGAILKETHSPNGSLSGSPNGLVLSVVLPERLREILLTFEKINKSRNAKAQCVGWHSRKSVWDKTVCKTTLDARGVVQCRCNCTSTMRSFSILMSPQSVVDKVLDYITCIGLSVSILSLVLCLIIEAMVWPRVAVTEMSHMRHVCLVNIAVSLLAANTWFIVGSNFDVKAKGYSWCVAVTFFSHFFYLSLFFWMLFKALLILYGILVVFRRVMKSRMIAIAFAVGYGCPLVIAATTVAVTEPQQSYMRRDVCWLNWDTSKALFAFAIPALVVVAVNLAVVFVVAFNTQRPSIGSSNAQDMAIIMRISKNVVILTPLLGLTWGFGIATLIKGTSLVFHIIFALLNAFQGFFILLFGTIMDHKIRHALRMRISSLRGSPGQQRMRH
ncbi:adhesion G protein-coupled receptor F4 [Fukomys damarensis]|uniref:adhesion G protein-coupled receptor F4 n=1 Tax=Fukomys damarensis TaxID=885580 RepID=UPI0008FED362|nr:adhesion G protein-coupled receptor F4 [Fukomys damarensis]